MKAIDISKLSDQEINDELVKRNKEKTNQRNALKELTIDIVPLLFSELKKWSDDGRELKAHIYSELKSLIELKFDAYGIKTGQKSHTFTGEKGERILIGYNVNAGYDDTVYLGIAQVRQFINSLIDDEKTAKLVNQINRLLRSDKNGMLDPKRVLELKQMANEYNSRPLQNSIS